MQLSYPFISYVHKQCNQSCVAVALLVAFSHQQRAWLLVQTNEVYGSVPKTATCAQIRINTTHHRSRERNGCQKTSPLRCHCPLRSFSPPPPLSPPIIYLCYHCIAPQSLLITHPSCTTVSTTSYNTSLLHHHHYHHLHLQ